MHPVRRVIGPGRYPLIRAVLVAAGVVVGPHLRYIVQIHHLVYMGAIVLGHAIIDPIGINHLPYVARNVLPQVPAVVHFQPVAWGWCVAWAEPVGGPRAGQRYTPLELVHNVVSDIYVGYTVGVRAAGRTV